MKQYALFGQETISFYIELASAVYGRWYFKSMPSSDCQEPINTWQ